MIQLAGPDTAGGRLRSKIAKNRYILIWIRIKKSFIADFKMRTKLNLCEHIVNIALVQTFCAMF